MKMSAREVPPEGGEFVEIEGYVTGLAWDDDDDDPDDDDRW